jgi:ribosomal protein S13
MPFAITNAAYVHAQYQPQTQESGNEILPPITDQPLEIWTFVNNHRVLTGKTLHLTVQVMWKLGITVHLENIDKINLHPFKVEGFTMGERQIFDNDHDYVVITYALTLPPDIRENVYSIPSFTLSYKNEIDQTEGTAASSPIAIKKVPLLVEGQVDKDIVTLGDLINYTLTIRHEKNVKILWDTIEKLNFSPFDVLKRTIEKNTEGNIEVVSVHYVLSLYELGEKKKTHEIPGLPILYYVESSRHDRDADAGTFSAETKEVKTEPVPVTLNSLLKAVDVPLEGIKGPLSYSTKDMIFHGHIPIGIGGTCILLLGALVLRSTVKKVSSRSPKSGDETSQAALERLRTVILSFQYATEDKQNVENIQKLDKALRTYLGLLIGISGEMAHAIPSLGFMKHDRRKQLSEEASQTIQKVLRQTDTLIFGGFINKESVNDLLRGTEDIIKLVNYGTKK